MKPVKKKIEGNKGVAKLEEVIEQMKRHDEQTSKYMQIGWNKFTYEDHEFTSCYICGHSDKAIIYELEIALKQLKDKEGSE